ncbi:hypothetical protein G9A89_023818 [Geosiphon pyriformis]|nr:hypothetical protein G9A89_023818 [Geosiphon pyriformis]
MNGVSILSRTGSFSTAVYRSRTRISNVGSIRRSSLYHFSNEDGGNLPFDTKNKTALAIKMILYLGAGFSFPFLAAMWQFHKAGKPLWKFGPP